GRRPRGPRGRKGEMETNETPRLRGHTASGPRPRSSIVPGAKLSTTMSAPAARPRTPSRPAALVQSIAALRLEVLRKRNSTPSSSAPGSRPDALQRRNGSPAPGRSIFSTSAPASARSLVQYGPATSDDRSRTRTPASGAGTRSAAGQPVGDVVEVVERPAVVEQHLLHLVLRHAAEQAGDGHSVVRPVGPGVGVVRGPHQVLDVHVMAQLDADGVDHEGRPE